MAAWETEFRLALEPRYQVVRRIGHGGGANVYLANDPRHRRAVAIKVPHPVKSGTFAIDRFRREITLVAKLTHPNILPLLDSGECAELPFFVMPFVDGQSLRERITEAGTLSVREAVRLAAEVADALGYAHAAGIIHRDVKPANVLLVAGHAVVCDFGIGRLIQASEGDSQQTVQGMAVGTLEYMSPEQVLASPGIDGRTDQYSLAIVLFEMLTGALPFPGGTPQAVMMQRLSRDPEPLQVRRAEVPAAIAEAVARALSRETADRFPNMTDFAAALEGSGMSGDALASRRESLRKTPTIAVLPFERLGDQAGDDFIASGLTEEITSTLGRLRALRVVARTSASRFKGTTEDVRVIGARLGADALLEGSVQRDAARVLVAARLVNSADGHQLWADRFVRDAHDVFDMQENVARAIVETLQPQLLALAGLPARNETRVDGRAHDLYLRGRYVWAKRTEAQLEQSIDFFQRAIEIDGGYALAHAGLADAYISLSVYGARAPGEALSAARDAANRALALDPTLAQARAALACVLAIHDWNWNEADAEFRRAIALDPDQATTAQWYATNVLVPRRRFDEALAQLHRAIALEPVSPAIAASLGITLFVARRYDESLDQLRETISVDPGFAIAHYFLGQVQVQLGRTGEAIDSFSKALTLAGRTAEILSALGHAAGIAGDRSKASEVLRELERLSTTRYVSPYLLAQIDTGLGNTDAALTRLEASLRMRATELSWIAVRPIWDVLREEPRFQRVVEQIGLTAGAEANALTH
jgi:serine/threonine-protein kinase